MMRESQRQMSSLGNTQRFTQLTSRVGLLPCGAALLLLGVASCSFDRFESLRSKSSLVQLKTPNGLDAGFGSGIASLSSKGRVSVVVAGLPGNTPGALFELGDQEKPITESADTQHCEAANESRRCSTIERAAALAELRSPSEVRKNCFISGVGRLEEELGLIARCENGVEFVVNVPEAQERAYRSALENSKKPEPLYLAADRKTQPYLIAASPEDERYWFYEPLKRTPIDFEPIEKMKALGASLAISAIEDGALVYLGSGEEGAVQMYRIEGRDVAPLGCLSLGTGFGSQLAVGDLNDDEVDDLVVSDGEQVHVFSGAILGSLPETREGACSGAALPEAGFLFSVSCSSGPDTEGCSDAAFGSALLVFDGDGDGKNELAVGAPGISVRGIKEAGAVLSFSQEGELLDTTFLGEAREEDRFGESLAIAPQDERDAIVVGAPGRQQAFVSYCSGALGSKVSPRCSEEE